MPRKSPNTAVPAKAGTHLSATRSRISGSRLSPGRRVQTNRNQITRAKLASAENPVALFVDNLLGFGDREGDRLLAARMGFGADEAVFLHLAAELLLDGPGGLIGAPVGEGRRANAIALEFDRVLLRIDRDAAEQPVPEGFEHRGHGLPQIAAAVDMQDLASDEPGLVGGEKHRGAGDVVGLGDAAKRDRPRRRRDLLFGAAIARL